MYCFGHIAQRGGLEWLVAFSWKRHYGYQFMDLNFCVALSSKYGKLNRMACVWKGNSCILGGFCRNYVFSMLIYFPVPSIPFSLLPTEHFQAGQQYAPLLSQCLIRGSLFKQCLGFETQLFQYFKYSSSWSSVFRACSVKYEILTFLPVFQSFLPQKNNISTTTTIIFSK